MATKTIFFFSLLACLLSIPTNIKCEEDIEYQKKFFDYVTEQLKTGKFDQSFNRGVILHGSNENQKNALIKQIKDTSSCNELTLDIAQISTNNASKIIKEIFDTARQASKPAIVKLISNNLRTSLNQNFFDQLQYEYNNNEENNCPILILIKCDKLEQINEDVRQQFHAFEFSQPSAMSSYEILKHKLSHPSQTLDTIGKHIISGGKKIAPLLFIGAIALLIQITKNT
ncbi:MAG: hypothetical protein WCD44_02120 [Candidatus Babeliales bacterium]